MALKDIPTWAELQEQVTTLRAEVERLRADRCMRCGMGPVLRKDTPSEECQHCTLRRERDEVRGALDMIANDHAAHAKHCMDKTWTEALAWAQRIARRALEGSDEDA